MTHLINDPRPPAVDAAKRPGILRRAVGNPTLLIGAIILLILLVVCWVLPFVLKLDGFSTSPSDRLKPPDTGNWFGTDNLGRDEFSRAVIGGMNSLMVAAAITIISTVIGTVLGLVAGFYRALDPVIMRICDGLMAFPAVLLGIAMMAALGVSLVNVVIALSIVFVPHVARVVRSSTLVIRDQRYVTAALLFGSPKWKTMFTHALPNLISPLIVQSTFVFADALISEAALSFIGAGIPAPQPSWGNMLLDGKAVIYNAWWMTVFPGVAIVAAVLSINLLGDGLRDLLDPKQVAVPKKRRRSVISLFLPAAKRGTE